MSVIKIIDVHKTYETSPPVEVLRGLDLTVQPAERLAIIGRSGAGKSTLLNILGLLDEPSSGTYELLGNQTADVSRKQRDRLRAANLGFVFQDYHILGTRTAYENVELKLAILGMPAKDRPKRILETFEKVGLTDRAFAPARLLSGGEKQRLAIARAIVSEPTVLLADEPTGNLDATNARTILGLFDDEARRGVAVVTITHDPRIAEWADRTLTLRSGVLNEEPPR